MLLALAVPLVRSPSKPEVVVDDGVGIRCELRGALACGGAPESLAARELIRRPPLVPFRWVGLPRPAMEDPLCCCCCSSCCCCCSCSLRPLISSMDCRIEGKMVVRVGKWMSRSSRDEKCFALASLMLSSSSSLLVLEMGSDSTDAEAGVFGKNGSSSLESSGLIVGGVFEGRFGCCKGVKGWFEMDASRVACSV